MGSAASTKKSATVWASKTKQRREGERSHDEKDVDEASIGDVATVSEDDKISAALVDHKTRLSEHPEIEKLLPSFQEAIDTIEKCIADPASSDSLEKVYNVVDHNIRQPAMTYTSKEQRRLICDQLAFDKFVWTIHGYCESLLNTGPLNRSEPLFMTYVSCADIITSLSDRSSMICDQCRQTGFLERIIQHSKENKYANDHDPKINRINTLFVITCISIVNNCAKGGVSRQFFTELDTIKAVLPYSKSSDIVLQSITYMTLAYLVDEDDEQSDLIAADDKIIRFLIHHLKIALSVPDKTSPQAGIAAEEIAQALSCLANNDKNKPKIMEAGTVPLLATLMKDGDEKEQLYAVKTIWNLAFDETCRENIKGESGVIEIIEGLKTHNSQEIQKAANGALWVLEGQQKLRDTSEKQGDVSEAGEECQHVMISYQWDVQNLMIKVKGHLEKNGYRVWMDLEQMGGSTLQAMADAVENSAVVLMCVSQKYRDSPNCRVEAEYAFQLRKDVVPLMVEDKYKPTGWLGAIVGTKFYVHFARKNANFEVCMKQLVRELGERGMVGRKRKHAVADISTVETAVATPSTSHVTRNSSSHPANKWTEVNVKSWMNDNGIEMKTKQTITGEDLVFLTNLRDEAPEFFYSYVVNHLGITTLRGMRRLRNALEKF
ncbi:uncharacterized protein [Ptychodera flava]|uniref:uncharacterized protein n=1 Tax=Ptychodera flava TaxID=63121 RepID=UPI003969BBCD